EEVEFSKVPFGSRYRLVCYDASGKDCYAPTYTDERDVMEAVCESKVELRQWGTAVVSVKDDGKQGVAGVIVAVVPELGDSPEERSEARVVSRWLPLPVRTDGAGGRRLRL